MKFIKKNLFFILIFSIIFSVAPVNDLHADEPSKRIVVIDDYSLVHDEDVDMTLSLLTALISSIGISISIFFNNPLLDKDKTPLVLSNLFTPEP